jgi:UDP-GlcNAc:undecaprenyl-phosphate/decaprenyl-phosphate GlcNAc-1-phosphate transferase
MTNVLLIFLIALLLSLTSTPLLRRLALWVGVVDAPAARKIHAAPVPLLGGVGIYGAFVLTLALFGPAYLREFGSILVGATLISLFGLADDRWGMSAYLKLGGQIAAATILVLAGVQVRLFDTPWLDWTLTVLWVVGITNAFNLLDNMDGLSGGVATVAAAFFLLLAAINRPPQVLVGLAAAALIGACIGFLRYNLNPATIFMGDAGSLFLGFILAALAIKLRFLASTNLVTWMAPIVVLGLPILDTSLVFVSRLRRGKNPLTTPGKDHISHRLVALGLSRREAVLICYLIGGGFGMAAVYITQASVAEGYTLAAALLFAAIGFIVWMERVCPAGVPVPKAQHVSPKA